MKPLDEKLRPYATPRQWELLQAAMKAGSDKAAGREMGIDPRNFYQVRKAVLAKASQYGYAPDNDMTHPTAPGFKVKGTSTLYDEGGNVRAQWVKTTIDQEQQDKILREMLEGMAEALPKLPKRKAPSLAHNKALMNVIPWGDPHFGLHCWGEEVGEDFDLKIAKRDLCGAVDYLVSQAPPAPRCVLVNLGDFYHAENLRGETERSGHSLDMDTRMQKIIRVGVAAIRQAVESALLRHETVEIVTAVGNHDGVLAMALNVMLDNIYQDEPRVIVHAQPTKRHYILHEKVMLGIVHGDTTKDSDLLGIMATERPEWWGQTRHRVFMRGHHHQDRVQEFNGGKVEQYRTLTPGDAYAVGAGFLSGRDMKLITYHGQYGEVARITCGIDLLRSMQ